MVSQNYTIKIQFYFMFQVFVKFKLFVLFAELVNKNFCCCKFLQILNILVSLYYKKLSFIGLF